jgi:transcriptional regulator GlxA family with amidase domain
MATAAILAVDTSQGPVIARPPRAPPESSPIVTPLRGGLAGWQIRLATDLICSRLGGPISVRHLAEACRLSVRHFSRAFQATTGLAPHKWIRLRRLEFACELLCDPSMSIAEIALAAGFADQAHLTHAFSRMFRTSPGHWRRQAIRKADPPR